ncbi:MAG: hypothetical protein GXO91_09900 [FCB group bacterium]|nr:hypothetical protein [FCB group bacterium]
MTPIKIVNGLSQEIKRLNSKDHLKGVNSVHKGTSKKSDASKAGNSGKDSVIISTTAKVLLEEKALAARFSAQMSNVSTADEEQLEDIKGRVQSGYYFRPEIDDEVAESMSSSVNPPATAEVKLQQNNPPDVEPMAASLDDIRLKIKNNAYNSGAVIDAIVKGLLGEE